jgi:hypothetical protein
MALLTTFITSPTIWFLYERGHTAPSQLTIATTTKTLPGDDEAEGGNGKKLLHPSLQVTSSTSTLLDGNGVASPTSASTAEYAAMVSPQHGHGQEGREKEVEMTESHVVLVHDGAEAEGGKAI